MTQDVQTRKPDLYIYAKVVEGYSKTRIGPRIGVAFKHNDGKEGFNIILDAQPIPVDGRIQLVGFPPMEQE